MSKSMQIEIRELVKEKEIIKSMMKI